MPEQPATRRQVMAFIILAGNPSEIMSDHTGARQMHIRFNTVGDLMSWLTTAKLDSPDLLQSQDVDPVTKAPRAYAWPRWRGWTISVTAIDPAPAPAGLDADTTAALTELLEGTHP